jgi:mannosyl-3-phosphoglycerate phosphatase
MNIAFSDLDGTFLDHHTYSYEKSMPGYNLLQDCGIPLIFVSSKTYAEIEAFCQKIGHGNSFIFENGGGFGHFDPESGEFEMELTGISYSELIEKKDLLERAVGVKTTTLDELAAEDVCELTGLPIDRAKLAKLRNGSLPFIIESGIEIDLDAANEKLSVDGLFCTRGGRFYHFSSLSSTKGEAVNQFITKNSANDVVSMGVGDSPNDIPMLDVVDYPYAVRKSDGTCLDGRGYFITEGVGPAGFTEAVLDFTEKIECR